MVLLRTIAIGTRVFSLIFILNCNLVCKIISPPPPEVSQPPPSRNFLTPPTPKKFLNPPLLKFFTLSPENFSTPHPENFPITPRIFLNPPDNFLPTPPPPENFSCGRAVFGRACGRRAGRQTGREAGRQTDMQVGSQVGRSHSNYINIVRR